MDVKLYVKILNNDFLGTLQDLGINKKDIYFQWKYLECRVHTWSPLLRNRGDIWDAL